LATADRHAPENEAVTQAKEAHFHPQLRQAKHPREPERDMLPFAWQLSAVVMVLLGELSVYFTNMTMVHRAGYRTKRQGKLSVASFASKSL
jgi:hypothetical protein